jgi:hypothetical protein
MTPEELIAEHVRLGLLANGDISTVSSEYPKGSHFSYSRGWFSWNNSGVKTHYRRRDVEAMCTELRRRISAKGESR